MGIYYRPVKVTASMVANRIEKFLESDGKIPPRVQVV